MTGQSVYFDHAATSPARPEVIAAMTAELGEQGNPSAVHGAGRRARQVVDAARERVAVALGARPMEVVFTAGGTESDNLALKGLYWARHAENPERNIVMIPTTEHHAIHDAALWLEATQGARVVWLPIDGDGRVDVAASCAAIAEHHERVAVVSLMWANNETGVIHPVEEIAACCAEFGIPSHTDATQAVGRLPVHFGSSSLTAMTVSGHKMGGPVGVGALLLDTAAQVAPVHHGGGQERKIRSGTLDPALIAGFGVATELACSGREAEWTRLARLRGRLVQHVLKECQDVSLTGPSLTEQDEVSSADAVRLPHIAHLVVRGVVGDSLLFLADHHGVYASTGSACSSGVSSLSHVMDALGVAGDDVGTLRLSLGWSTTDADVDHGCEALPQIICAAQSVVSGR